VNGATAITAGGIGTTATDGLILQNPGTRHGGCYRAAATTNQFQVQRLEHDADGREQRVDDDRVDRTHVEHDAPRDGFRSIPRYQDSPMQAVSLISIYCRTVNTASLSVNGGFCLYGSGRNLQRYCDGLVLLGGTIGDGLVC